MALSLTATLNLAAALTKTHDLQPGSAPLSIVKTIAMSNGTGAGLADMLWSDTRNPSANDSIDFNGGGLVDALSVAIALAKLKFLYVSASGANTANLNVTRPTAGIPFLGATGDFVIVPPGGGFLWWAPVNGVAVTPTTADLIDVAPASGTQTFDMVVAGTSA